MINVMKPYVDFAKDLANQAGEIMLQHFQVGVANDIKEHEGNTPVTIADKTINTLVIEAVKKAYPSHAVIGEEESYRQENAEYVWVCDPIDGTVPFVMGMPTNVFSLAMLDSKDGQPVIAVVYDPYMKRTYWATKNGGAFLNGLPIHVNAVSDMSQAMIGGSGKRSNVIRTPEYRGEVVDRCFRTIIVGSIIYEAMLVASGQIAATVFPGAGCHDVASAKLIVDEAGGKVTDVFGHDQRYDQTVSGAVISNGLVHDELVELANTYKL
jgi:myo-inositol-1(or 4)-monophosphatase